MTSCKPPPTCIDASPIPDANDSRMSAIPYEANLTPMGGARPAASAAGRTRPAYSGVRLIRRTNQPLPCPAAGSDFTHDAIMAGRALGDALDRDAHLASLVGQVLRDA